jgi:FMN-dependent NADH-azoreductase
MDKPILYINACVRQESRTKILAEDLLDKLGKPYEGVKLSDITFPVVNEDYLNQRDELIEKGGRFAELVERQRLDV